MASVIGIEMSPARAKLRAEHLVERLAGRRAPGLAHVVVGVGLLHRVGCCGDRVDVGDRVVVRAVRRELDQRRVSVIRDLALVARCERRAQLRHLGEALDGCDRVGDDCAERGIARPSAVGDCTRTYSDCSSSENPPSRMM